MLRKSGILLHISSLPGQYGIGDFGIQAYKFVDYLAQSGQSLWQILPLNPVNVFCGSSPYNSYSSMAINPLFISPDNLLKDGFLIAKELAPIPKFSPNKVDYEKVSVYKDKIFSLAYKRFKSDMAKDDYQFFCQQQSFWLEDYASFMVFKRFFKEQIWTQWPKEIRDRQLDSLKQLREKLSEEIEKEKFLQYLGFKQWQGLRAYCNQKRVKIIGDIPIYVSLDSVDVWANNNIFNLDNDRKPITVAGVPPDYFSKTGQLWGNPTYRWDVLQSLGFKWWLERIKHNLALFDFIRIDHFRGLVAYWQIPSTEKTAVNGQWVQVPVNEFLSTLANNIALDTIIAEDLGVITDDVKEVMKRFGFPGMKILLFAFSGDLAKNPYAPHNHITNCLLYTGTHDNNTIKGWYKNELTPKDVENLDLYLGRKTNLKEINWDLIHLALMSVANFVILPLQDLLGLDSNARMNTPATTYSNWQWRCTDKDMAKADWDKLGVLTKIYNRVS